MIGPPFSPRGFPQEPAAGCNLASPFSCSLNFFLGVVLLFLLLLYDPFPVLVPARPPACLPAPQPTRVSGCFPRGASNRLDYLGGSASLRVLFSVRVGFGPGEGVHVGMDCRRGTFLAGVRVFLLPFRGGNLFSSNLGNFGFLRFNQGVSLVVLPVSPWIQLENLISSRLISSDLRNAQSALTAIE